jgi:predicted Mrr-cat superfamily restriction endonuclease
MKPYGHKKATALEPPVEKSRARRDGKKEIQDQLDAIAAKMKTAKGKELDALVAEVDKIIGFQTGDDQYDPEKDGAWESARKDF